MPLFLKVLSFSLVFIFSHMATAGEPGLFATGEGIVLGLGDSRVYPVIFVAPDDFRGKVQFSMDHSAVDAVEGSQDISLSLDTKEVVVSPGQEVLFHVVVNTRVSAPSMAEYIDLIATTDEGELGSSRTVLEVLPRLEIKMFACEYQNKDKLDECWDRPAVMELRPHASDIELNFVNCDVDLAHTVHGNRPIQHGDTGNPLEKATSVEDCGGEYLTTVAGDIEAEGSYYMHDTQGGSFARYIRFGVQEPTL